MDYDGLLIKWRWVTGKNMLILGNTKYYGLVHKGMCGIKQMGKKTKYSNYLFTSITLHYP